MLKRSVAIALATVASIGIAASMSTDASAKPTQVQRVQSSPKVMNLRQVNPNFIKPKYKINAGSLKTIKAINPKLVAKPTLQRLNPNLINAINNNNNKNTNTNTNTNTNVNNNTNVNTNTNVNANFNGNSSVSVADSSSVVGAAAVAGTAAVVGTTAVAGGPVYARAASRSCLTKEYLQTGQVLFRDLCTSEWAVNPPAATQ
jgi:hypothetical protein